VKIAILCREEVSAYYAAALSARGHEIVISGAGAIHAVELTPYLECDGCLLLSDDPRLVEIADYMATSGKKIWRQLPEVPSN